MCACGCDKRPGWRECCNSLNIRYLYEVRAHSGLSHSSENWVIKIVIAKNSEDAINSIKNLKDCHFYDNHDVKFEAVRLDFIDGYKIELRKMY